MRHDITETLRNYAHDPNELSERLIPLVYERMRGIARRHMASERRALTIQPTVLTHEAFLRLLRAGGPWKNRNHFLGAVSEAMRRILIEHARHNGRARHGGGLRRADTDPDRIPVPGMDLDAFCLREALEKLEQRYLRKALVARLRFFLGLSIAETALALDISPATVKLDWSFAKAFLHRELAPLASADEADCG